MNNIAGLRSLPYQPFFVAIFIGLSIYTPNRLYFPFEAMVLPMCILISLIVVILIILKYTKVDMNKGLIFISGTLFLNFTYYPVRDLLAQKWLFIAPATIIYGILLFILIAVTIKTTHPRANNIARILGISSISLVIIGLANLGFSVVSDPKEIGNSRQGFESQFHRYLAKDLVTPLNNRDFYFIVLDRYPGEEILYAQTKINNNEFYKNLRALGFTVLEKSKSNYGITEFSLPSMLNMDFYTSVKKDGYNAENNRLASFFKSQGFKFIFLPSNWYATLKNANADITLNPYPLSLTSGLRNAVFQKIMFFERTFIGRIYYTILHVGFSQDMPSQSVDALQKRIQNLNIPYIEKYDKHFSSLEYQSTAKSHIPKTFEHLSQVSKIPGRKFVFSHINHWEYVKESELASITYVNKLVESLVKVLIEETDPAPVIVIMSDHGRKPWPEAIEKNRSIYAKYARYPNKSLDLDDIHVSWYPLNNIELLYLPDGGNATIYPGMTPVNVWRIILNYYFGTDFARVDDRCYWKWRHDSGILELN
jgi:hypothetical protein